MAELDARRAEVLGNAARIIQRQIRTYIARKEFMALRKAAIQLQSQWRGIFLVLLLLKFIKNLFKRKPRHQWSNWFLWNLLETCTL